jgi:hypothetical protein
LGLLWEIGERYSGTTFGFGPLFEGGDLRKIFGFGRMILWKSIFSKKDKE